MSASCLFFDLDGTLNDSAPGIRNSARFALQRLSVAEEDIVRYSAECVGPPLRVSFQQFFPKRVAETEAFIQAYREYYASKGLFENTMYPGALALLQELYRTGTRLFLATSKAEPYARQLMQYFGMDELFEFIGGDDLAGTRNSKAAVLQYVMGACAVNVTMHRCLMVGDRLYDVQGAHAVGMPCCGVLYGYGSPQELQQARAEVMVADIPALGTVLQRFIAGEGLHS